LTARRAAGEAAASLTFADLRVWLIERLRRRRSTPWPAISF